MLLSGKYTIAATPSKVEVQGPLTMAGSGNLYNGIIQLTTTSQSQVFQTFRIFRPGESIQIVAAISQLHEARGQYPLFVSVTGQDNSGRWITASLGFVYYYDSDTSDFSKEKTTAQPTLLIDNRELHWQLPANDVHDVRALMTTNPDWRMTSQTITPEMQSLPIQRSNVHELFPGFRYDQQLATMWRIGDLQYCTISEMTIVTDHDGDWHATTDIDNADDFRSPPFTRNPVALYYLALFILVFTIAVGGWQRRVSDDAIVGKSWRIRLLLLVVLAWLVSYLSYDDWWTHTRINGGDVASHILYAHRFIEWFFQGKLSSWSPEVFAGFPAFTYYFPLPFIFMALASIIVEVDVAIKLVVILPAVLLPILCYRWMRKLNMSALQSYFVVLAVCAFLLTNETVVWGGNIPAQLAGEFAYSWGMVTAVLFFIALTNALSSDRFRPLFFAILAEMAVALSHGFALLVVGFASFAWLFFSQRRWADFKKIMAIHTVTFFAIGFWMLPLIQNLSWTIPNDGTWGSATWPMLWGKTLWPFALGVLLVPLYFRAQPDARNAIAIFTGVFVVALIGYAIGREIGLAEIRFFPFAQFALAIILGASLGWFIQQRRNRLLITLATTLGLWAWWQPMASNIEQWASWDMKGYEAKPLWPTYQKIAQTLAGSLDAPRVLFEHDPDNHDLGSTRTLEALPLFGSRPVLEGLYMESALLSPFVYQIQADISERPSGPLARYPVTTGSIDQAIHRMDELYVDTLLLRSDKMKDRFRADARFQVVLDEPPFLVVKRREFSSHLVDVITQPLISLSKEYWLDHAVRRFVVMHPYQDRLVFDDQFVSVPLSGIGSVPVAPRVLEMSNEKLVFETSEIGHPHLIRMTYHPRWRSTTGEPIYLTEPAFMLVIPKQSRVELVFANSWGQYTGWVFTIFGVVLVWVLRRYYRLFFFSAEVARVNSKSFYIMISLLISVAMVLALVYNENDFFRAHQLMAADQFADAAPLFDNAVEKRKIPAFKAEALFWSARNYQWAGNIDEAMSRYQRLYKQFPDNYWWPETAYRLIELAYQERRVEDAYATMARLLQFYPGNKWTDEARNILPYAKTDSGYEMLQQHQRKLPKTGEQKSSTVDHQSILLQRGFSYGSKGKNEFEFQFNANTAFDRRN